LVGHIQQSNQPTRLSILSRTHQQRPRCQGAEDRSVTTCPRTHKTQSPAVLGPLHKIAPLLFWHEWRPSRKQQDRDRQRSLTSQGSIEPPRCSTRRRRLQVASRRRVRLSFIA
jgi:hypothetical protein